MASAFDQKITLKAQVMYVEDSGYCGLRFLSIKPSDQQILKNYIEKFSIQQTKEDKKAA